MDIPMSLRFQMHTEISQFSFFCTTTIDKYVESFSNLNFDYSIALNKVTGTANHYEFDRGSSLGESMACTGVLTPLLVVGNKLVDA